VVGGETGTKPVVTLRLPASAAHVRTARLVAAAMARRSGIEEGLLDEVRLAVGEACARAVRLHERFGVDEPVTVEFIDDDRFEVAVVDRAPAHAALFPLAGAVVESGEAGGSPSGEGSASGEVGPGNSDNLVMIHRVSEGADSGWRDSLASDTSDFSDAPWADPTGDALGLALLGAVVQDLAVRPGDAGGGSRVSMSWPVET
jgi:Histidine kinase-like ATPase domain